MPAQVVEVKQSPLQSDERARLPEGYVLVTEPSAALLDLVYRLRVAAWRGQATLLPGVEIWSDRWDESARHFVLLDGQGDIAGAFRFHLLESLTQGPDVEVWGGRGSALPKPIAYFSRMFVAPSHQGLGLSRILDRLAIEAPRDARAACVVATTGSVKANRTRIDYMTRLGWTCLGPGEESAGSPYYAAFPASVFVIDFTTSESEGS